MAKPKNSRRDMVLDHIRAQAGIDRAEFFANGGELARWRGLHLVRQDRKKNANKKSCRSYPFGR